MRRCAGSRGLIEKILPVMKWLTWRELTVTFVQERRASAHGGKVNNCSRGNDKQAEAAATGEPQSSQKTFHHDLCGILWIFSLKKEFCLLKRGSCFVFFLFTCFCLLPAQLDEHVCQFLSFVLLLLLCHLLNGVWHGLLNVPRDWVDTARRY